MKNLILLLMSGLLTMNACASNKESATNSYTPNEQVYPSHEPYGTGVGTCPGRVTWTWNRSSVEWDGTGYWWRVEHFDETAIQEMTDRGIANIAGAENASEGWKRLFEYNLAQRGLTGSYQKGQKIAIKANINGAAEYDDDREGLSKDSYTNGVVPRSVLVSIAKDAGVRQQDITVYDVTRIFPDWMQKYCSEGITEGVNFIGRDNGVADENVVIKWSALNSSVKNYLPTCVTEATYLINLANLKGHDYGITLCAKNHFGSFINTWRMRAPQEAGLHGNVSQRKMNAYSVLVDLMGNYQLGAKTMLYMLDAIICPAINTSDVCAENSLWTMPPFNGDYTSSLFFSQDPVAIDGVGADFLMNEPTMTNNNSALRGNKYSENYIHEAALVGKAPSGTAYYDGNGKRLTNLGVHEHWNNATDKQYSRNLGKSEGIELVVIDLNGASGIVSVSESKSGAKSKSYNVAGQSVDADTAKGIIIQDRKKIIK